jgi:hypothetical protein
VKISVKTTTSYLFWLYNGGFIAHINKLTVIATRLRVEKNETEILEILTEKFWYLGTEKPNKLK